MLTEKIDGFTRKMWLTPAYHKVHEDPKKNFGVHGLDIHFVLIGPKGAVNWTFFTGCVLDKTIEWWKDRGDIDPRFKGWMGTELRYHSPKPMFENQTVCKDVCDWLGVPCYTDAGYIMGGDMEQPFLMDAEDYVWKRLENHYNDMFQ